MEPISKFDRFFKGIRDFTKLHIDSFMKFFSTKKFAACIYISTLCFIIMLVDLLIEKTISQPVLEVFKFIYGAFVLGNVVGDHYGKAIKIEDKKEEVK